MQDLRRLVARHLSMEHSPNNIITGFIIALIALNVLASILATVPSINEPNEEFFYYFNLVSVMIFTVEYLCRVWSCIEFPDADNALLAHWKQRVRYLFTPGAIIDLLAILPFYLTFFFSIDLRFLRTLRLLRILKLTRYSGAVTSLIQVLRFESRALSAAFFILFIVLVMVSSGIYLLEHKAQPEAFGTIPDAMWWAMATLTTVGYGDVTPITPWGKIFGGFITILAMGMVALPAGILASGFSDYLHRRQNKYLVELKAALADGIITGDEMKYLESLSQELNLNERDTEFLMQLFHNQHKPHEIKCPKCGHVETQEKRAMVPPQR